MNNKLSKLYEKIIVKLHARLGLSQFAEKSLQVGWETACGWSFRQDWYVEALSKQLVKNAWVVHWNWNQESWDENQTISFGGLVFRVEWDGTETFFQHPMRSIEFDGQSIEFSIGEDWGRYAHFDKGHDANYWADWFHRARQEMAKYNSCSGCHSEGRIQQKDCEECRADWKRIFGNDYGEFRKNEPMIWLCSCGEHNDRERQVCRKCGLSKPVRN